MHAIPSQLFPARSAPAPSGSSVRGGGTRVLLAVAAVAAIVAGTGLWVHHRLEDEVHSRMSAELVAVRETATRGVESFLEVAERLTGVVAAAPEIRAAAAPGESMAWALAPYIGAGRFTGYLRAGADGIVGEASEGLGEPGVWIPESALPVRRAARAGGPQAGLPYRAEDGRLHILVAAAVPGTSTFLGLAFNHQELSEPLVAARVGASGETYAFDARGLMISSSRFPQRLRAAGLIGPNEDAAARVVLIDPGGNLPEDARAARREPGRPLTLAATRAIAGETDLSLVPYRDYRGVPVVGAWTWLPARGFGVVCEVDAAEAFEPLVGLERIFGVLLALVALGGGATAAGSLFAARARRRAVIAERQVRRLGAYVVQRPLGSGATGDVFLAQHAVLKRPTALKLLRDHRTDDDALERFEREVRVTASMSHPNTVAIYDFGRSEDGRFYYAMEYLDGMDLDRLVTRHGPCPEARVVHILRQACESLGAAHARGLVHRDVKPANIFICRGSVPDLVKVLDFGLARLVDSERVTRTGAIVGTPTTMAPELFESTERASAQSDIYALGCVGYFLLTGQPVFSGASLAELCNAHLSRAPAPPSARLGRPVDGLLERTLLACLAKDPRQRPASAAELTHLLGRCAAAGRWTPAAAAAFWAAVPADAAAADAPPGPAPPAEPAPPAYPAAGAL